PGRPGPRAQRHEGAVPAREIRVRMADTRPNPPLTWSDRARANAAIDPVRTSNAPRVPGASAHGHGNAVKSPRPTSPALRHLSHSGVACAARSAPRRSEEVLIWPHRHQPARIEHRVSEVVVP